MARYRKISTLTALAFTLAVTGCSSGSGQPQAQDPASASGAKGPLKLSFVLPVDGVQMGKDSLIVQELGKRSNTDLTVTAIPVKEYSSRMNLMLASGEIPDIVIDQTPNGQMFSTQTIQAIKGGLFHDLTPYIEDPEFDKKYPNLAYSKDLWELTKFNGKIYGLPRSINELAHSGIWIRKDLWDKSGLKLPTNTDELADMMIKVSKDAGIYGLEYGGDTSTTFSALTSAFTGQLDWAVNDQGDFTYYAFNPKYKDYLLWMKKLYDNKAIDPEFSLGQKNDKFDDGKAAVYVNAFFARPYYPNYRFFKDTVPKDADTTVLDPIKGPAGWAVYSTTGFRDPALLSSKVPKEDIPRFFEFWNYLASDDKLQLEEYGIEGVHYKVEDGKKVRLPKYNEDVVNKYEQVGWNKAVDKVKLHADAGATPEIVKKMYSVIEQNQKIMKDMHYGFPTYGIDAPKFSRGFAGLIKDLNDNRVKVIMGAMTLEQWDQYVKDVTSSAPYQEILAELKDGYLKNKGN